MVPMSLAFFFTQSATTEIYTLSLHDALPICLAAARARRKPSRRGHRPERRKPRRGGEQHVHPHHSRGNGVGRSEEHTSELQSRPHLVCRLLLEKKKSQRSPSPSTGAPNVETE